MLLTDRYFISWLQQKNKAWATETRRQYGRRGAERNEKLSVRATLIRPILGVAAT